MPRKEDVRSIDIPIGEAGRETVKMVAAEAGYTSMAKYIRDLIKKDVEARGHTFDDGLDEWGRGRKKKSE